MLTQGMGDWLASTRCRALVSYFETTGAYMDTARVHFHLFKASNTRAGGRSLESLIKIIDADALDQRIRKGGVRLDSVQKVKTKNGIRKWFLEFTKLRDTHGPGKTSRSKPVEDLDLADDEFFGEETAALFLPDSGFLIVQYNHFGVRPKAMQDYFSEYLENETNVYELTVRLDPDALQRFRKQAECTRLRVGIDISEMTDHDRSAGNALGEVAAAAAGLDAVQVEVTISVGRKKRHALSGVKDTFLGFLAKNATAVTSAYVSGRETAQGAVEVIDLIHHKLVHGEDILPGPGRRLPFDDRKKALGKAYTRWSEQIEKG